MKVSEFKNYILAFSTGRSQLKVENAVMIAKINIAMKQVARDTTPLVLIKDSSSARKILKRIDNENYVCIPNEVKLDSDVLEMDVLLLDAVALFVLSGIETPRAPAYMKMYYGVVEEFENSLINDELSSYRLELKDYSDDASEDHFFLKESNGLVSSGSSSAGSTTTNVQPTQGVGSGGTDARDNIGRY